MSGKERIESLTASWYGFSVFTAFLGWLDGGSLLWSGLGLCFSFFITFLIGNRLLAKSGFVRLVMLAASLLASAFAASATVKLTGNLLSSFHFGTLLELGVSVTWLGMNIQSFRVLTDKSVKAYFA